MPDLDLSQESVLEISDGMYKKTAGGVLVPKAESHRQAGKIGALFRMGGTQQEIIERIYLDSETQKSGDNKAGILIGKGF